MQMKTCASKREPVASFPSGSPLAQASRAENMCFLGEKRDLGWASPLWSPSGLLPSEVAAGKKFEVCILVIAFIQQIFTRYLPNTDFLPATLLGAENKQGMK